MKFSLAFLCLFCTLLSLIPFHSAWAEQGSADDCASYPDIPVNVISRFDAPQYDFTQDISSIMSLAGEPNFFIHDGVTLGLTRYQPFIDVNLATKVINLPDGLTCAKADHVDVTIGYKDVKIYIPSEVPQGSCGFNELMDHEHRHIEINQELLQKYQPIVENEVTSYLKLNGLFREPNYDYAISLLHDKVREILGKVTDDFNRDNTNLHTQWDQAETARLNLSCYGELITIIQNHHIVLGQ